MENSVRAAQIYDELTRQNEEMGNGRHRSSGRSSRARVMEKLKTCIQYPLVYTAIIMVFGIILTAVTVIVFRGWVKENITFRKPVFDEYKQAEIVPIYSDITQGVISREGISLPELNDNYAEIQCDKLGEASISVFYRGDYDAEKLGVIQETSDNYFGFPGSTVAYAYHTTFFKNLSTISPGDKINVTTSYGKFVYKVYKTGIENRQNSINTGNDSVLVLYTDEFSGITGNPSSKYIYVYASLFSGPTVTQ